MTTILLATALISTPQTTPTLLESLKQFEGHWKGVFSMGVMKMDVDLTWSSFGGRWSEVSYSYSSGKMKLDYRVLITQNSDNSGFSVWMFGNDMPTPDTMKGAMDGKILNILHERKDQPDVKFWIDGDKNLVMSATSSDEKHKEFARGLLKRVKK